MDGLGWVYFELGFFSFVGLRWVDWKFPLMVGLRLGGGWLFGLEMGLTDV